MNACVRFVKSLFCCDSCPGVKTSISPKIIILVFLYSNFLFYLLMLQDITPITFDMFIFCGKQYDRFCRLHSQIIVIYRTSLALYLFFCFMAIATHRIKSSRDDRSPIHNGCWFIKLLFLAAITTGCLFIPPGYFDFVFTIFGAVHSLTMVVFELTTLLSVAYKFACICQKSTCNALFCIPLLLAVALMAITAGLYSLLNFRQAIRDGENEMVVGVALFNIAASYIFLIGHLIGICILKLKCMVLHGGVLCCHVVYFTTFALFHSSKSSRFSDVSKDYFDYVNNFGMVVALVTVVIFSILDVNKQEINRNALIHVETRGKEVFGIWGRPKLVNVIWPEVENINVGYYPTVPAEMYEPKERIFMSERANDDEYNKVRYKWRDFYIICNHLTMFMMMSLTKWKFPTIENDYLKYEERNPVALWSNFVSCWFCYAVFIMLFLFGNKYYE